MGLTEQLGSGFRCLPDIGERARFHKLAKRASRGQIGQGQRLEGYSTMYNRYRETLGLTFCRDEWKTPSGHYTYNWLLRYFINLQGKQRLNGEPLVVMDFGGGLGYEMVRLAAKEYYREIRQGRIVFVVTNLGCDPTQMGKEEIRRWTRNETEQLTGGEWDQYITNRSLVRFMTGDVNELRRKIIWIQDKEIPLWGNIDLVHERLALCHGYIPEIEIPMTGLMLKDGGRLLLWSKEPQHYKRICRPGGINYNAYRESWATGMENLGRVGLETQNSPLTDYRVYKRVTQ